MPSLTILFERLRKNSPEFEPDVLLVDGNGIFHTRGFGSASHIGVVFDIPSIGVGKNVFNVDGLGKKKVKEITDAAKLEPLGHVELIGTSGRVWGAAL